MSEHRVKVGVFEGGGLILPKISGRRGHPHQPFLVSENWMHQSFIRCKSVDCRSLIDRRTHGWTDG